jgi:hypothetical protein
MKTPINTSKRWRGAHYRQRHDRPADSPSHPPFCPARELPVSEAGFWFRLSLNRDCGVVTHPSRRGHL